MQKVAIVGGGILGLALGYEMSLSKYKYKVCIFEKENTAGYYIVDCITNRVH
jgi:L-2-hydroxyglutarate oxidase LhgO